MRLVLGGCRGTKPTWKFPEGAHPITRNEPRAVFVSACALCLHLWRRTICGVAESVNNSDFRPALQVEQATFCQASYMTSILMLVRPSGTPKVSERWGASDAPQANPLWTIRFYLREMTLRPNCLVSTPPRPFQERRRERFLRPSFVRRSRNRRAPAGIRNNHWPIPGGNLLQHPLAPDSLVHVDIPGNGVVARAFVAVLCRVVCPGFICPE